MSQYASRYYRPIAPEEEKLYHHLLYWIDLESPQAMIERFRALLIHGTGYPDSEVAEAVKTIVTAKTAAEEFRYVLNRCCHILINHWQARRQTQSAIPALIKLFETPPAHTIAATHSAAVRRQHQLIRQFITTEQYQTLHRLAQVLTEEAQAENRLLGPLIRRYPYLYEHCLLSEDSTQEQQATVRQVRSEMQRQFEIQLAHYVIHRTRVTQQMHRSQTHPSQPYSSPTYKPESALYPAPNPTLLDDRNLAQALRYYTGKVDGARSHRDQALNLLSQHQLQSFAGFKANLYEYMTAAIDADYGRKFNHQLYQHLALLLPENHAQPVNDFLLVRTCNQLLSFLVVDSPQRPNHYVFIDLINNLGAIATTGILLRVVLLCRKVIPALERRLSILFNHYELHCRDSVQWLIQALENINLALTTNFGMVRLT